MKITTKVNKLLKKMKLNKILQSKFLLYVVAIIALIGYPFPIAFPKIAMSGLTLYFR